MSVLLLSGIYQLYPVKMQWMLDSSTTATTLRTATACYLLFFHWPALSVLVFLRRIHTTVSSLSEVSGNPPYTVFVGLNERGASCKSKTSIWTRQTSVEEYKRMDVTEGVAVCLRGSCRPGDRIMCYPPCDQEAHPRPPFSVLRRPFSSFVYTLAAESTRTRAPPLQQHKRRQLATKR